MGATCGGSVKTTGMARIAARRILNHGGALRPLRKAKAQSVHQRNATMRLELRRIWDTQIASVELDHEKIFIAEEMLIRIGAPPGGNNNIAHYVRKELKKSEAIADLIIRDDGGDTGASIIRLHRFATRTYRVDIDIALSPLTASSAHTAPRRAERVLQEFCAENPQKSRKKEDMPSTSPGLGAIDYYVWDRVRSLVDKKMPKFPEPPS